MESPWRSKSRSKGLETGSSGSEPESRRVRGRGICFISWLGLASALFEGMILSAACKWRLSCGSCCSVLLPYLYTCSVSCCLVGDWWWAFCSMYLSHQPIRACGQCRDRSLSRWLRVELDDGRCPSSWRCRYSVHVWVWIIQALYILG